MQRLTDDNHQCMTGTADSTTVVLSIAVGKSSDLQLPTLREEPQEQH